MAVEAPIQRIDRSSPATQKGIARQDRRPSLSLLWVFAMFNYLYADVLGLFDMSKVGTGLTPDVRFTQGLLFAAAVMMEIPIAMVLLSWALPYTASRWANIVAGVVQTAIVLFSTFIPALQNGSTTGYYLFFGAIEVVCTGFIVWYAWTWHKPASTKPGL